MTPPGGLGPTRIRLHAWALALQLFRERLARGLLNLAETVEVPQLRLQLVNTILHFLREKKKSSTLQNCFQL